MELKEILLGKLLECFVINSDGKLRWVFKDHVSVGEVLGEDTESKLIEVKEGDDA